MSDFHRFVQEQADRLEEAIDWVWDLVPRPIRAALVAADDAQVPLADDPTEEEYR